MRGFTDPCVVLMVTRAGPSGYSNIAQGAQVLVSMLNQVKSRHPDWSAAWQLRGAVAGMCVVLRLLLLCSSVCGLSLSPLFVIQF
jgi:hypothetical protein